MKAQQFGETIIHSDNEILPGRRIHGGGKIVREYTSLKPKKSQCSGCRDNFYNSQGGMDGTGCWSFKSATVVDKVGHSSIYVENGPDTIMRKTLSCWHAVSK